MHVLDEISRSLPDRLWLTELKQVGSDFTIMGFAASLPSLSDFVANLEATKWFKRPVEILDSQVTADKVGRRSREVLDQRRVERSRSASAASGRRAWPWARPGRGAKK